ncbi:MAG: carotenoid biosynthesis protein [Thermomicrobiales bacterium]|nr:carotenoid biosynthesis protein [Thermomicrobiales bacterium]
MSWLTPMRLTWALLTLHLVALVFGLIGMLIMLPNPDLWAHDRNAVRVFDFSMQYAGAVHIWLGAAAMFAYGVVAIGWRKTAIFAAIAYPLSLTSELFGTGTGWPFGNYAYTDFLGPKAFDHVPWSIPASWFYMGLASYLLGSAIVAQLGVKCELLWSCLAGAWLLTAWDLVLDPAMAHESLRIKFWIWDEAGPYFGMPVKNFIGWTVTAFLFMVLSRFAWRESARIGASLRAPVIIFVSNMLFAIVISASVGLWIPIALAIIVGVAPLLVIRREQPGVNRFGRGATLDA